MVRLVIAAALACVIAPAQEPPPGILHVKVVLPGIDGTLTPVPRHALLISANPASAAPRRIVTGVDGTAEIRLRPGNYTVESDQPVTLNGQAYTWTQSIEVAAGREALLELTLANADVEATTLDSDASFLLATWQNSVVALWTPTTHASGFVIDPKGLIATNQRVVGTATSVEVQIGPSIKVMASVIAADFARDVAVLWVDANAIAALKPVPLPCDRAYPAAKGQDVFTIGAPLRGPKRMTSGTVGHVDGDSILTDVPLPRGSAGGPVFSASGELVGITSVTDRDDRSTSSESRIVPRHQACGVIAAAAKKMTVAAAPSGTHLPVEPARPFPADALKEAASRRAGSLSPYQISTDSFDVAFITPVLTYGTQYQSEQMRRYRTSKDTPLPEAAPARLLMEFANWSDYVWDFPPVLLVRVTPRLVEGFWTRVGRVAARTQGLALPPFKRIKSGFSRLRVFCGTTEATPVHPFKLEHQVAEKDTIYEGLYVFDPAALGPHCGAVKVEVFSEKEPMKAEGQAVDPRILEQVWSDFAAYRAGKP